MYYVSFEKATKNLPVLAVFCINVYIPCFFEIKKNSKFTDEAKIVKFPHKAAKEIYFKVKKRNGYFANPENIFIGMLGQEETAVIDILPLINRY